MSSSSGHNHNQTSQHGRGLSQTNASPTPSWSHLQVPSQYTQLQMAHMSNERSMPAAWHNSGPGATQGPPPPAPLTDQQHLYGPLYMQQSMNNNNKSPLDMVNSMISSSQFMRQHQSAQFSGTMDLSVATSTRNNSTSPRQAYSSSGPNMASHLIAGHSNSTPTNMDYASLNKLNNRNSTSPGVIQGNPPRHAEKQYNGTGNGDVMMMMAALAQPLAHFNNANRSQIGIPPISEPMQLIKEMSAYQHPLKAPSSPPSKRPCNVSADKEGMAKAIAASMEDCDSSPNKRRRNRKPNKTSRVTNEEKLDDKTTDESMNGIEEGENVPLNNRNAEACELKKDEHEKVSSVLKPSVDMLDGRVEDGPRKQCPNSSNSSTDESINKKRRSRRSKDSDQKDGEVGAADMVNNSTGGQVLVTNGDKSGSMTADLIIKSSSKADAGQSSENVDEDPEKSFEEVENKLTEMFAEISDSDIVKEIVKGELTTNGTTGESESAMSNGGLVLANSDEQSVVLPAKNKRKAVAKRPSASGVGAKKRTGSKGGKGKHKAMKKVRKFDDEEFIVTKAQKVQTASKETVEYRGPLVQVRRDGTMNVLNGPQTAEDDTERQTGMKGKKFPHTNHNSERNKIRGLHVSTLSMKYDADRTDRTWMCVFCKLGPHKMGLGDLFGPYVVTTSSEEFQLSQIDPERDEFKSNRTKLSMIQRAPHCLPIVMSAIGLKGPDANKAVIGSGAKRGPKKKEKLPPQIETTEDVVFYGMAKMTDTSYEIWMHEDCLIWAPGIHMIAGRLIGLEESVWGSTRSKCILCSKNGANISCLQRGCGILIHVPCGRQSNWDLNDDDLKGYCQQHTRCSVPPAETATNFVEGGTGVKVSSSQINLNMSSADKQMMVGGPSITSVVPLATSSIAPIEGVISKHL